MMSDCHSISKDIELYVLDGLDGETRQQVERHLQRCAQCQDLERQFRLLLCEVEQQLHGSIDTQRLAARVRAASHPYLQKLHRQKRLRYCLIAMQSIAALVMAFLAIRWIWPDAPVLAEPSKTVWQKTETTGTGDDVAAQDGLVFFLQQQKEHAHINAAQADSGTWLWQSNLPSLGYLETDKRRVYCVVKAAGSDRIELAALDQKTGQTLWTFAPQCTVHPLGQSLKPTAASARCLYWIVGNQLFAINPQTGALKWKRSFDLERRLSRAVIMRRRVFVAGLQCIYCLSGHNGDMRWQLECSGVGEPGSSPLLAAGGHHLFVAAAMGDGKSRIQCIDCRTRTNAWHKIVPNTTQMVADARRLYLRCQGVLALNQKTGRQHWQVMAQGCGPLTVYDGVLCFVDQAREGHLVAIHRSNGALAWHIPGLHSGHAFVKTGNRGFLKTLDSTVLAFAFEQ